MKDQKTKIPFLMVMIYNYKSEIGKKKNGNKIY